MPSSSLQLDHLFCCCSPELPEAKRLEECGFTLTAGRTHEGQGTANRCLLFTESYLELIYLSSRLEAESNPLQLHRRADWKTTGTCPFGIGLRGTLAPEDESQFWKYHPSYSKGAVIWIHKSNEENPKLPLVFVVPPIMTTAASAPTFSPLPHRIVRLEMAGPGMSPPSLKEWPAPIVLKAGASPSLSIYLDGPEAPSLEVNSLLRLLDASKS